MENEMTGYILTLLENYAKTTKEIELLRYELQHCNIVSPEEMIETLALSRRENNPDSRYPHDVAGIAMCFREVTDRLNKDASNEVAAQYVALVRERERLQYYMLPSVTVCGRFTSRFAWIAGAAKIGKQISVTVFSAKHRHAAHACGQPEKYSAHSGEKEKK